MPSGPLICGRCNNVIEPEDVAFINGTPYCDPLLSSAPTCYMKES